MPSQQTYNSIGGFNYNNHLYTNNISMYANFHKNFELIYVCSGKISITINNQTATVSEGEYVLILPNQVHSFEPIGDSIYWIGVFSGDFVHSFEKQTRNKVGEKFVFRCEESIHQFLLDNLINDEEISVYLLKSCLYAVCYEYSRQIKLVDRVGKNELLMHAITDYISQNYKEKITLADMAENFGYNYHYLSKYFHKTFNISFSNLLSSYRLDAALELLNETDMDITTIAFESGFQSVRAFNDFFKSRVGITPSQYRTTAPNSTVGGMYPPDKSTPGFTKD